MIRTLLALLPPNSRRAFGIHLALTVVGVALRAAGAVLLVPLIGALFGDRPADAWPWLGALAAVTVAGWAIDAVVSRLGFGLGFGLLDHAQHRVADQLAGTRLTWFTADNVATARQAIAATGPDLVGVVIYLVTPLLGAVLLPIAIAIALFAFAWPLGLAALAGVPVLLGAFWAAGRSGRGADRVAAESNSALTERLIEFARTQPALRAARRVEPARSHAGAALAAQHAATVRVLFMQIPGQLLFTLASQIALVVLAGTTAALTVRGDLEVAQAVALIVVIARYLEAFTTLSELAPGIETAAMVLGRLGAVIAAPGQVGGDASVRPDTAPRIELRGVGFRYGDDAPVLDGIDLTLAAGTTTAIVGPSGSGKSTLLALLAGLHTPTSGSVLVDGTDCATLDVDTRRALVSVVFQHPYLFDGTIRDNVRAGHPGASAESLDTVAALARVDDLTERLPDGWDTRAGEAGTALSGGERQRVSIARALLKPAPILLIDEATSALDTENEAAVVRALTADPAPRTRVIVAHRLASIRTADRVLFLDEGRVVEDGTIDELLSAEGRFAEFWRHQHATGDWRIGAATAG
ncbi:ABC transporter ATP-binding protein [Nocardia sp. NPDC004068]|uniref:ABC transporter ATP-binding protein n=1 Tax=Nocardia sp. NPDC004068 TaxID=3364303 RepID=UPI0036A3C739